MAQWKRAGPITQRSVDRNYALLMIFLTFLFFVSLLDEERQKVTPIRFSPISAEDSALDF